MSEKLSAAMAMAGWLAMSKEDDETESEEQPVDKLRHLRLPTTGQGRQTTIPHFWESFGPKTPTPLF
jgi:hypothetical protein